MPSRSAVVSMLLIFAGYTLGSYAYVLVKGWNISPSSWLNPLHPYQWPTDGSNPLCVPPGQLFGNGVGGVACSGTSTNSVAATQAQEAATAKRQGRPIPGSVASRY